MLRSWSHEESHGQLTLGNFPAPAGSLPQGAPEQEPRSSSSVSKAWCLPLTPPPPPPCRSRGWGDPRRRLEEGQQEVTRG